MDKRFRQLMLEKKRFLIFALSFSFIFYFMLPVTLIFIPEKMNQTSFIAGVTWAWLYAFLQIIMIWILGFLYHKKAERLDRLLEQRMQEE